MNKNNILSELSRSVCSKFVALISSSIRESGFGLVTSTLHKIEFPVPSSAFFLRSSAAFARSRDPVSLRPEPLEGFLRKIDNAKDKKIVISSLSSFFFFFFFIFKSTGTESVHFQWKSIQMLTVKIVRRNLMYRMFEEEKKKKEKLFIFFPRFIWHIRSNHFSRYNNFWLHQHYDI